eukprot:TRINITY_DN2102_c1_g1_i3.p1 TRINITY_DN2102_c1_g1~~TRINITY_DN2102_c1_g1_i3.p1  ORF type:complete len:179 (-),score=32.38 TRINITY_DN2102_c1_g1_i3:349-885(-)
MQYNPHLLTTFIQSERELYDDTQALCRMDFNSHSSSSLSGLFFSILFIFASDVVPFCGIMVLRFTSSFFGMGASLVYYHSLGLIHPTSSRAQKVLKTLIFHFSPPLLNNYFQYSTDTYSLFCVLLTYNFSLRRKFFLSALAGMMATLANYHNIIWLIYIGISPFFTSFENEATSLSST